ncbi:MAG: VOC family protein [Chloroflexi bacterium]|nr:VOC family protein [Chloroflexota bacterium]MCI0575475.1 VOC family protein [Chloroflexota bacterium]MCI0649992.1 VOC family protein [Chloroflexota bacterium]MCI0728973.1 VOC family protein [Chloroflexota bacterium]
MTVQGLHHITLVSADAQRTVDFYTGVLGLRLVKKTVNFDDPGSYHLYFGDEIGRPGTAVTFFEWPHAPKGRPGIGGTHHFALIVKDSDGLLKWKRRLTDLGLAVTGPYDRHYFQSIYFRDPDGVILEIATQGPGWTIDEAPDKLGTEHRPPPAGLTINHRDEARIQAETWPEPVPAITPEMALSQGMHHISAISSNIQRTHDFLSGVLELRRVKMSANFDDPSSAHWYWGSGDGRPGTVITYFEHDPARARYHRVQMGTGQTHHFAFGVPDEATQLQFRDRLIRAGYRVSPVMERVYFKSIYTNDPDGHIVELATAGPGFLVDEDRESLGRGLALPSWLEPHRAEIEQALAPLTVKAPALEAA